MSTLGEDTSLDGQGQSGAERPVIAESVHHLRQAGRPQMGKSQAKTIVQHLTPIHRIWEPAPEQVPDFYVRDDE